MGFVMKWCDLKYIGKKGVGLNILDIDRGKVILSLRIV